MQKNIKNLRRSIKSIAKELKVSNDYQKNCICLPTIQVICDAEKSVQVCKEMIKSLIRSNCLLRQVQMSRAFMLSFFSDEKNFVIRNKKINRPKNPQIAMQSP